MICGIRHPLYQRNSLDWEKWRLVYAGDDQFINRYLVQYSDRESPIEFADRRKNTPTPNFAKAAVNDIRNSIFQRLSDVNRRGGSKAYQEAVRGDLTGVDLHGSSMNSFVGLEVLPELLVMGRVGIFVDMPRIEGRTLRDAIGVRPYIYRYCIEDILSWTYRKDRPDEFQSVLLRDHVEETSQMGGLPMGSKDLYRFCFLRDGKCVVQFYEQMPVEVDSAGNERRPERQVDVFGNPSVEEYILDIPYIPFISVEISDSLLADTANHQIALLNLESSDVNYALKANFPFYTEQADLRADMPFNKGPEGTDGRKADVGVTKGRRYGKDMDRPGFIAPPSEPLKASMEKQQALKDDIRLLVNLSLSNVKPKFASAESKQMDERGLDSGLSSIGLVLQHAERKIAHYWKQMEKKGEVATILYPEKWSLRTDADRREDAKNLRELRSTIPSATFQRSISKEIARLLLEGKTSKEDLDRVISEIDSAEIFTADPEAINDAVDRGYCDLVTAAGAMGMKPDKVEKATKDHEARLERILASQMKAADAKQQDNAAARGVPDADPNPNSGKDEKLQSRDKTESADTKDKTRGKGDQEARL